MDQAVFLSTHLERREGGGDGEEGGGPGHHLPGADYPGAPQGLAMEWRGGQGGQSTPIDFIELLVNGEP